MTYKRYEKYKDSKIDEFGEIPSHWDISKVKYELKNLDSMRIPLSSEVRGNIEKIYDYYGASGVIDKVDNYIFDEELILIGEDGANLLTRSTPLAFIARGKFWVNNHAHILKPINNNIIYLTNQLELRDYTTLVTGSAQPKLTQENLGNLTLIKPPIEEQEIISKFLNKKTLEIDALIEEKEKLIELLKEKREAIITEVVTNGIDKNIKMKDSGIKWFGNIPFNWEIKALKLISDIELSNVDKKSIKGERNIKLCNYTDVYYNEFIDENIIFMEATAKNEQIDKFELKYGDVIITKDSESANDIAVSSYVEKDLPGIICGYHLALIRPKTNILGKYIYYSFKANGIKEQFYSNANGVTRFGIGKDCIKNVKFVIPSHDEQKEIVKYLDLECIKINDLIYDAINSIEYYKKYRKSLISEVVTGKIDVRNEV
ncbi:restriction endonuclease subunit S [Clostridium perfringens]|uniref:restriction endonuclease subunit S n=1 Tax=Clostridium perfringens TaxID=1502 RepID=UPI001F2F795F|nr:restriction endonuclease subunit S [Clostridium perfringens]MDK0574147.1 restriction endonuclease subunit S [Clostridium perfringens]UBL01194.1 restriction endonuclease subunit S [Clostridium perfringens]